MINTWQGVLLFYSVIAIVLFISIIIYSWLNCYFTELKEVGLVFMFCAFWFITVPWFIYDEITGKG